MAVRSVPDLQAAASAAQKVREWTERRDRRIREALHDGASLRALGTATGLSHTAIAKIAKRGASAS